MSVTTVQKKKGGPYTKPQQERLRNKVYELYFEKGFTAVKIAQKLDINRNTVNDYIQYWNSQIGSQFGAGNLGSILVKQLECLDIQRQRLLDELDKQDDVEKKLRIEKLLFEIDQRITGFILKMGDKKFTVSRFKVNRFNITHEISEQEIKDIVLSIPIESRKSITEDELLQKIIAHRRCDLEYAESVFNTMKKLGLDLFSKFNMVKTTYNLVSFAVHRGYQKSN